AESARALVDLVLELEEPVRSTILLRYGEELAPRAIAERLGVPARTVESRLRRGLARLRERWRARFERDEGRALAVLARLARSSPPHVSGPGTAVLPATLGVLLVNTKLALGVLLIAVCGGVFWLWNERGPGSAGPPLDGARAAPRASAELARDEP